MKKPFIFIVVIFLVLPFGVFAQTGRRYKDFQEQMLFIVPAGKNTKQLAIYKELTYAIMNELADRKNIIMIYSNLEYNLGKPDLGKFSLLALKKYCQSFVIIVQRKSDYILEFYDIKQQLRYSLVLSESYIPSSGFKTLMREMTDKFPPLPTGIIRDAVRIVNISKYNLEEMLYAKRQSKKLFSISAGFGPRMLSHPNTEMTFSDVFIEFFLFFHYNNFLCSGIGYTRSFLNNSLSAPDNPLETVQSPLNEIIIIPISFRVGTKVITALDLWTSVATDAIFNPNALSVGNKKTIFFKTGLNLHFLIHTTEHIAIDLTIGRLLFGFHPELETSGSYATLSIDLFAFSTSLRF